MERIDIHIEVPRLDYEKLSGIGWGILAKPFAKASKLRNIQCQRFSNSTSVIICNAVMRVGEIRQFCRLQVAMTQLNLSAQACHRTLNMACMRVPGGERRYPVCECGGCDAILPEVVTLLTPIHHRLVQPRCFRQGGGVQFVL